ncbi:MAG: DUF4390 domain-containing protein [Desulfovibrio sp.]
MTGISSPRLTSFSIMCMMIFSLIFSGGIAHAQTLVLKDLVIDSHAGMFMARFGVGIAGQEHVLEVLNGGVSVQLNCDAQLVKRSTFWNDSTVLEKSIKNTIHFDSLNKEFVLTMSEGGKTIRSSSLKKLVEEGWSTINMELGPWSALDQGEEYSLKLIISLEQTDIPGWFERTLVFWSWDVAPSTSYQLDFSY